MKLALSIIFFAASFKLNTMAIISSSCKQSFNENFIATENNKIVQRIMLKY